LPRGSRLDAAGGAEPLEIVIQRFGGGPISAPREFRSTTGQRIIVTEEEVRV
jgi:hypothetical protein